MGKYRHPTALLAALLWSGNALSGLAGEITQEYRYYPHTGLYETKAQHDRATVLRPEYSQSWDQDRMVFVFSPYLRAGTNEEARDHADVREFSFTRAWNHYEIKLGISKVFWGVTESTHLVDVINQTDLAGNPDGEDKLGQPLLQTSVFSDLGNFEFYVLPYFRERTFTGENGRLRGALAVDPDEAIYLHADKARHRDYALRWSHSWQDVEWALSWFKGTDRDPGFRRQENGNKLTAVYGQSRQWSLEAQWLNGGWLLKSELLRKNSDLTGEYVASVSGLEYTFANLAGGMDLGLLYEWLYDNRNDEMPSKLDNASFTGARLALNDVDSTEFLLGAVINNADGNLALLRLEASGRLTENISWTLEYLGILLPPESSSYEQMKQDDYGQFALSYHW